MCCIMNLYMTRARPYTAVENDTISEYKLTANSKFNKMLYITVYDLWCLCQCIFIISFVNWMKAANLSSNNF